MLDHKTRDTNHASYRTEPIIAINGQLLTPDQAAAVRIAIAGFLQTLGSPSPAEDSSDPGPQCRRLLTEVQLLISALPPAI